MKRLVISVLIIVLLSALCALHVFHLQTLTEGLIDQLNVVETCLIKRNWSGARKTISLISEEWERHGFYLHTTLRHTEIDAIRSSIKEVISYLDSQEDRPECLASIAKLINQLELLLEAELPSIKNLF